MKKFQILLPYLILSVLTLIFSNCADLSSEQEALWKEVMDLHDTSMVNHGEMMQLGKDLRKFKDNTAVPPALQYVIKPTMEQINKADEDMMDWMKNLKGPVKVSSWEPERITPYWTKELEKIKKIDEDIIAQKNAATELLRQIKGK